jgi:DNA sulfur modification protein DndE
MNAPIEHIYLSQQAKEQLIVLKRRTGIQNWNVLCRWAFTASLADAEPPTVVRIPADSSVEMTWKVFGGTQEQLYLALLRQRCLIDGVGLDDEVLAQQFRLHLHRGIGLLFGNPGLQTIADLVGLAIAPPE